MQITISCLEWLAALYLGNALPQWNIRRVNEFGFSFLSNFVGKGVVVFDPILGVKMLENSRI